MIKKSKFMRKLSRSKSGIATTELALTLPFLLTAGLWGVELANYSVVSMRVSQLAMQVADNASRIGDQSTLQDRKIYEADINDLLMGANIQSGNSLGLFNNGRVIISSLEVNDSDDQYIHWQRCMGRKVHNSSYGVEAQVLPDGMGPPGEEIVAFPDEAVMFVEIAYEYQPLISSRFVGRPQIGAISSFSVRADRDLSQIYQRDTGAPDPVASCSSYDNPFPAFTGEGGAPAGGGSSSSGGSGGASSGGGGASSGGGGASSGGGGASSGGKGGGKS